MKCTILLVCLLWTLPAMAAEVYRWTDPNGQVHYGERPPTAGAQRMELPETTPGSTGGDEDIARRRERERRLLESYDYERAQKKSRREREASEQQAAAEQCRKLQAYWRRLSFAGPLYIRRDDGGRDYLSDEQRVSEKARVRPAYVRACGREP